MNTPKHITAQLIREQLTLSLDKIASVHLKEINGFVKMGNVSLHSIDDWNFGRANAPHQHWIEGEIGNANVRGVYSTSYILENLEDN